MTDVSPGEADQILKAWRDMQDALAMSEKLSGAASKDPTNETLAAEATVAHEVHCIMADRYFWLVRGMQ